MELSWLCGLAFGVVAVAVVGHLLWLAAAAILNAMFGAAEEQLPRAARPFRYCPACNADTNPSDRDCPDCGLHLDSRQARELYRVRTAEREVRGLVESAQLDQLTAEEVLMQLELRARSLRGLPAKKPRAMPVAPAPVEAAELAPADAVEVLPSSAASPAPPEPLRHNEPEPAAPVVLEPRAPAEPPTPPPKRGLASFLESHNILWGELVGGLLIVGCSIALVVTLRQTLEAIPYFRFMLSVAVTLALFGAGEYTLHRWKLAGTSRGMLVISMLLTPLTLLLLAEPFTQGASGTLDVVVKLAAVAVFIAVARTGGRDLIRTEHLPGPIDRRWLLALAVVGAPGTQLLPASLPSQWLALACFIVACGATLGGLSWYHPSRRADSLDDKSGTALLMFIGLATFALLAAWGLYIVRAPAEAAIRLHALALPLALAGVPVVEAGVLVLRRVESSGLRTMGTAVALAGFVALTGGLTLAWPNPLVVLLVSAAAGAFLTRVAFRERLPWVQAGAFPLLAFATVIGFHGAVGNWPVPAGTNASVWLAAKLGTSESGAMLAGFALLLAIVAELLARRASRHTASYALGGVMVGAVGLLIVSWHGIERPAVAAFTHAALALGLLVSNARWERRAVAHGGLWLALAGTMWALWWHAPRQTELWGFVAAVEAFVLAAGAVTLRGTHGPAIALLRRAARDVAFATCVLAVVLAINSATLRSEWHTGTLFTLALTAVALARLTGSPLLTWAASVSALFALVHLGVYTLNQKPETLAVEAAVLMHATLATLAAIACRRQARVFGDPLRWAARVSTILAIPLLFFPPVGLAQVSALFAVWLGLLWLVFSIHWRAIGAFSAFQSAITLAALLTAFASIEHQPWWESTKLYLLDPRALHAFGLALGTLSIGWILSRRMLHTIPRVRELWSDNPLSLDRVVLGVTVAGFVVLTVVAVLPGVREELTPLGRVNVLNSPASLTHAFDTIAWWLLGLLALATLLSWRLTKVERDTDVHALGLALLFLTAPVVWAGTHAVDLAAASALRWGLGAAFALGSIALALRAPLRRFAEGAGFPVASSRSLRVTLLALFALAAGVIVLLSAEVAEIGLSRLKPTGPAEVSIFALMGALPSNLMPLALVVFGLSVTAGRERSSGYALSGGLVFVATLTAGYALAVITAGSPLDATEQTRLFLVAAGSAAVWALAWLAVEWRVPGSVPLTVQVCLGFAALGLICFIPAMQLLAAPGRPLAESFDPLAKFGWSALALVAAAGFWHLRRVWPEGVTVVFVFIGLAAGVLLAVGTRGFDVPDRWLSFHVLALAWAAVCFGFLASPQRDFTAHAVILAFAVLLVVCGLRGAWFDPWRPWLPAGLTLGAAFVVGSVALRTKLLGLAVVSGLTVNLAAVFLWITWGEDRFSFFVLANAAGLAAGVAVWTLVRIARQARSDDMRWLDGIEIMLLPAFGLLLLSIVPTLGAARTSTALPWGALAAVAAACIVGVWDRAAKFALPGLYASGVLAVLLAVAEGDSRAVWDDPMTPPALALFTFVAAVVAFLLMRAEQPFLRIPQRDGAPWLLGGQTIVAAMVLLLGLRLELISPLFVERVLSPASVVLLALAYAMLLRVIPESPRAATRTGVAVLGVLALGFFAWAVPDPDDRFVWLHRNGWLFVALAGAAVVGSEVAARLRESWQQAARRVAGWTAALAVVVLCVNLIQQVPVFDPIARRTPLSREAAFAMLAGIAGLIVIALRFALQASRDPFALPPMRRTAYVYLAEVLLVLFFTQVRFNVPEFFRSELAKFWTFAVMILAYIGIGLAELFERKKLDVLAVPLRRTGVLLPLIPLLAFWAKPPALLSEFARGRAPGLGPLLGYLEKLPQHFDTYAWLWFLAGGVYALVALSRRSFGWALLAALATNAAMWSLLAHHQVPFIVHPQAWVIPLALIVLVSEHINRKRLSAEVSNTMRYAGIAMIYVASAADMFLAGVGNSMWLPVILAALCVAGVLTGILMRVRAFVYLGVGFLLLDLFAMIWYAAVDLQQTWVWYASGIVLGVVVLGLFAYLEKRRTHAEQVDREPLQDE